MFAHVLPARPKSIGPASRISEPPFKTDGTGVVGAPNETDKDDPAQDIVAPVVVDMVLALYAAATHSIPESAA